MEIKKINGYTIKDEQSRNGINRLTNDLDNEIEERINNDNIINSQISSLASGSPLVASSTSEMTNTNKTYVNTTDGYWYYYNNGAWTQGGIYQSTGINNGSINHEMFNSQIMNIGKDNIFNPYICTDLTGIDNSTGLINQNDHAYTTDFIPVTEDTTYYNNVRIAKVGFYDSEYNWISNYNENLFVFTTPQNCSYVKFQEYYEYMPFNERYNISVSKKSNNFYNRYSFTNNTDKNIKVKDIEFDSIENIITNVELPDLSLSEWDLTTGIKSKSTRRISSDTCFYIPKGTLIFTKNYCFVMLRYNKNKEFIESYKPVDNNPYQPYFYVENSGYYNITFIKYDNNGSINLTENDIPIIKQSIIFKNKYDLLNDKVKNINELTYEKGSIHGYSPYIWFYSNTVARLQKFLYLKANTRITCLDDYQFLAFEYNDKFNYINKYPSNWGNQVILNNDNFYSIIIRRTDLEELTSEDLENIENCLSFTENVDNSINTIGEFDFEFANGRFFSDMCFIDNELWVFSPSNDLHTEYEQVRIYDIDFENKTATYNRTIQHNLGHVNSIDYCKETDTLICGNGSSDKTLEGELMILSNVSTKESLEYSDCIKISIPISQYGYKLNVVWGDNNNGDYNIIYAITNDNQKIYKILLNKTNDVFNGDFIILKEFTSDYIDVNNGTTFYNGKLYIGMGHNGLWINEYTLNNDGTTKIKSLKDIFYDEEGNILSSPYTEGVTIYNNYILVGSMTVDVFKVKFYKI